MTLGEKLILALPQIEKRPRMHTSFYPTILS